MNKRCDGPAPFPAFIVVSVSVSNRLRALIFVNFIAILCKTTTQDDRVLWGSENAND